MIIRNEPALAPYTTLRLGGSAIAEILLEREEDCERLTETLERLGGTPHVLGGGSNLLIHDGHLPITVLRPLFRTGKNGEDEEPALLGEETTPEGRHVLLGVGAGMRVPYLLNWCARRGLAGLEGLAGVPGRVGGLIAMNAGAYGCSTAPLLRSLTVFTPEKGLHTLGPENWEYSYRSFSLKEEYSWYMVVHAVFSLPCMPVDALKEKLKSHFLHKKSTQPLHEHTAGCVFKNPTGDSAGRLLDVSGMKGTRQGALFFSPMHANFLAHDTRCGIPGTAADALELIEKARDTVREVFGVVLEMEVKEWPCRF